MKNCELLEIVTEFRSGILTDNNPEMMCFAVCFPLQGYLSAIGVNTKIVEADFGVTNHVWLELEDGQIIDPTASQFVLSGLPPVYIGPVPEIYKTWVKDGHPVEFED